MQLKLLAEHRERFKAAMGRQPEEEADNQEVWSVESDPVGVKETLNDRPFVVVRGSFGNKVYWCGENGPRRFGSEDAAKKAAIKAGLIPQ